MLKRIRTKIELYFLRKSFDNLQNRKITKGMRYLKLAVWVAAPSKELSDFGDKLRQLAERYKTD